MLALERLALPKRAEFVTFLARLAASVRPGVTTFHRQDSGSHAIKALERGRSM
jgi:hypothetical protein